MLIVSSVGYNGVEWIRLDRRHGPRTARLLLADTTTYHDPTSHQQLHFVVAAQLHGKKLRVPQLVSLLCRLVAV